MKVSHQNGVHGDSQRVHDAATANGFDQCNVDGGTSKVAARRRSSRRLNNNNNNESTHFDQSSSVLQSHVDNHQATGVDDSPASTDDGTDPLRIPTRTEILKDPANLCTLAGAILATLAMASMWQGRYYTGMCLNVAANIADILDGPIARMTANRHPTFAIVGCKLDCYSDLVSHFVVPASLLMHLSDTHPICTALAAMYICAGILRQSYFEVTGRCDGGTCIYGMTSDYMVVIYSITMHLRPLVDTDLMPLVLSASIVAMIFSSLTFSIRSRRYDGFGLFTVTVYNILLCISCLVLVLFQTSESIDWISGLLFAANLVLAYPCYFRFVELNR